MKITARAICTHAGCNEVAIYSYDSRKECASHAKRRSEWKCTRHQDVDQVLSVDNLCRKTVLTATKSDRASGLYWHNGKRLGSGFVFGDGYKAFAKDFPEGTKLTITAQIDAP